MTRRIFALLAALAAFGATGARASAFVEPAVVWISPPPLVEVAPQGWSRAGLAPEAWLATSRYRPVIYNHPPEFVVYPIAAPTWRHEIVRHEIVRHEIVRPVIVRHRRRLIRQRRRGCR